MLSTTPQQVASNRSCQELVELLQAQNCSPKIIQALQDHNDCDEWTLLNCYEETLLQTLKLTNIQLGALKSAVTKSSSSSAASSNSNIQSTNKKTPRQQTILNELEHDMNQVQESEEHIVTTTTIEPAVQNHDDQSSNEGNADDQFKLGLLYNNGEGCEKSIDKAFVWYEKSANQGDANAQYHLGVMYCNGEGCEQSFEKAFEWFKKSANQGDANAQYRLGMMYNNGEGCEQSLKKAFELFKKSANQGNAIAQFCLDSMYDYSGEEV